MVRYRIENGKSIYPTINKARAAARRSVKRAIDNPYYPAPVRHAFCRIWDADTGKYVGVVEYDARYRGGLTDVSGIFYVPGEYDPHKKVHGVNADGSLNKLEYVGDW